MSEFKVGDRVKYVGKDERYLGLVGEIEYLWKTEKIVGVDVGEELPYEFFIENLEFYDAKPIKTQEQQKIEELEQRIEKLEKEVFKPVEIHDRPKETKPSLLTEDERVILRNVNKEFKWIIRNEHYLTVTERKPRLDKYGWSVDGGLLADLPFIKLFKFIKFQDGEPYNIEELLKGERGNE